MIRRFFLKRLRSYFFTMILPTLLIFIVIGYSFLSSQGETLEKRGIATISSIEKSMETTFYNAGYQIDALLNNSSFALSLRKVFKQIPMEQKERYFYEMLKNLFLSYEVAYPYMHSAYIYMDGYERFMTSTSGQIAHIDTHYDMEWLDIYRNMPQDERIYTCKRWVQRNAYDEPKELISVFYRNNSIHGVTIINIDKNEFGELLRTLAFAEQQIVFLLNNRGDIVCATDSSLEREGLGKQLTQNGWVGEGTEAAGGSRRMGIDNTRYRVYTQHIRLLDIFLVSAISEGYIYAEMSHYLLLGAVILLVDILFILFLAYYSTKRSFRFVHECVAVFDTAERDYAEQEETADDGARDGYQAKASNAGDEYELVLSNIGFLHAKSRQMQRKLLEKQYQYKLTEMMALQMQINPHFIFNTLQIADIEIVKAEGVASVSHRMLRELSKVVQYALTNPMEEVTLEEELDYLKSYLEIQSLRFGDRVIAYFDVGGDAMGCKVFRLLLQPMYENCFTHGMRTDGGRLTIRLRVHRKDAELHFTLFDNGRGMGQEKLAALYQEFESAEQKSIGLPNVNRRLVLRYGEKSALKIVSKENVGTVIRFLIPVGDGEATGENHT